MNLLITGGFINVEVWLQSPAQCYSLYKLIREISNATFVLKPPCAHLHMFK